MPATNEPSGPVGDATARPSASPPPQSSSSAAVVVVDDDDDVDDPTLSANNPTVEIQGSIAADSVETDSALGAELASSVASLSSSILQYQLENGRSYHSLSRGKYVLPNDEMENERLDLQHELYVRTCQGILALCPKGQGAQRVLDMGTGTGQWAIDFADLHPDAEVIGVDLSPIQPDFVPPNLVFEIDDLEKEWTWTTRFDFIFARMMLGCFQDLPGMIKVAYDNLEPGGYLELQDMALPALSDDGTLAPDSYLAKWCKACLDAGENLGRPVFPVTEYKNYLAAAGFEDIVEVQKKWPTNTWPREREHKELGAWAYANIAGGLDGLSLAHFTRGLGWTPEETRVFCAEVRKDLKNPKIHAYWPMYVPVLPVVS
ncbi:S-adenosyl-L-methionine-dependent methyltransferase [Emericellopsis atlantica]|uniref:S-adenosyl-L-methionine-dependent methyltransferase n=1 Tax=Emericellopsis atlantica TaxID=2614577 RepID=A0A9P8CNH8_9HYPO|nr:S-adenosyl-L-methionine-dependent methyltransferase [Emericellopsis atlantica]KAG9253080.1 S-adenosyl-L-methionine-dependent methyltransferase [Emericellopsis atlantica]